MTETVTVQHLLAAGLTPDDVVTIAEAAVRTYDLNRKPKGSRSGALRDAGCGIYRALLRDQDYDPTLMAFLEPQPYSADMFAERLGMVRASIADGLNRLIEHRFAKKERIGRNFSILLMIPERALTEYGEWHLAAWEPQMAGYLTHHQLAEKMLEMYPRSLESVNNGPL